jgi:ribosomal protein L11 methyltransferase
VSFRVTVPATRAQAEAVGAMDEVVGFGEHPPVLVADEPDPHRPDAWLIHAYFEHSPSTVEIAAVARLGAGEAHLEQLGEADWVTMSQAGLQPIRAGRFFVHTPTRPPDPHAINFEIDASLAFGTGQHATTSGCLHLLDALASSGQSYANIADIGTGTGLLAFAALALWPNARCIASDIDPVALAVARDNAAINRVKLGHGAGELLLAEADGMDSPLLAARAPFDLIVANILAGPLIALAADFARALAPGGTLILAGLLDTQAAAIAAAYEAVGLSGPAPSAGEWPVLAVRSQPRAAGT